MNGMPGGFVWCDLSAFNPSSAQTFYAAVLGWSFSPENEGYSIASTDSGAAAGIYEMPAKFRKIGMPSFWMSYIQVADVARTVDAATRRGGKTEIAPTRLDDSGSFALIRDPLGAGFTVYDGDMGPGAIGRGARVRHALYVSEPRAVQDFYRSVFAWSDEEMQRVIEAPEDLRGPYEFWGVHFGAEDLDRAEARILEAGGAVTGRFDLTGAPALLAADMDGAAFFVEAVV
ncbi:MAG: VOC family protein [Pseudomonadota bacterium]